MQPDFLFAADGGKKSEQVGGNIHQVSLCCGGLVCTMLPLGPRAFGGSGDMKLKFEYYSYTVHICCNYIPIDTDGHGYICSNVGVCIYDIIYIYIYWQFDIYSSWCSASCDMKSVWRPQKIARQVIPLWDAEILTSLLVQPLSWMHSWLSGCLFFPPFARILRSVFVKQIPGRLVRLRFTGSSIPAMLVTVGGFYGQRPLVCQLEVRL